jgi:hypothetical protein
MPRTLQGLRKCDECMKGHGRKGKGFSSQHPAVDFVEKLLQQM